MIPPQLIIGAATGSANLISNLIGSAKASRQLKRQEQILADEKKRAEAERLANQDYMATQEARTIANMGQEALQEAQKTNNDNALRRGYTTEQSIAQNAQSGNAYANLLRNLASNATKYRQYYDSLYRNALNNYSANMSNLAVSRADSSKNAWQNIGDAAANMGNALMAYTSDKPQATTKTASVSTPPFVAPKQGENPVQLVSDPQAYWQQQFRGYLNTKPQTFPQSVYKSIYPGYKNVYNNR